MCLWQSLYRKGTSQTRSVVFLGYHSVGSAVLNSGSPAMSEPSTAARRSLPSKSSCQRSLRDSNPIRSNRDWLRIRKVKLDKETKLLDGIILIGMNRHSGLTMRKYTHKDTPSSFSSLFLRLSSLALRH